MHDTNRVIAHKVDRPDEHVETQHSVRAKMRDASFRRHYVQVPLDVRALAPISVHIGQYFAEHAAMCRFNRIEILLALSLLREIRHCRVDR